MKTEGPPVANGAAQDPAQDVVAVVVTRQDAVGNREGKSADVIRDDAKGDVDLNLFRGRAIRERRGVFFAAEFFQLVKERAEDVGFVIGDDARKIGEIARVLHDARHALEPHARIDVPGGQGGKTPVRIGVELNEDEVPNFDATGVAFVDERTFGVASGSQIDMDFRAGAAGAGFAHHPKVVFLATVNDVDLGIETGGGEFRGPEVIGIEVKVARIVSGFVGAIDSGVEAVAGEFPDLGDQFPGPINGLFLEIIAKAPVAQHLEKGVVIGVQADVFEVVVLAAGTDALLGVRGAGGRARDGAGPFIDVGRALVEEYRDELIHAGVGEKQAGRIGHEA